MIGTMKAGWVQAPKSRCPRILCCSAQNGIHVIMSARWLALLAAASLCAPVRPVRPTTPSRWSRRYAVAAAAAAASLPPALPFNAGQGRRLAAADTPAPSANSYDAYAAQYDALDGGWAADALGLSALRRDAARLCAGRVLEVRTHTRRFTTLAPPSPPLPPSRRSRRPLTALRP